MRRLGSGSHGSARVDEEVTVTVHGIVQCVVLSRFVYWPSVQ